jgi:hypothetical protein
MRRARKVPDVPLSELRMEHLLRTPPDAAARRLVNLKVPADLLIRVHRVARQLGVTKTAALIAVLNEGLGEMHKRGLLRKKSVRR